VNKFFIPGPTKVDDEVLKEMIRPMIGHRSPEYAMLHEKVIGQLKKLFGWENYHVFLVTASATGIMEAAIRNCVDKYVMHTICGAFSEKWAEISELNGKRVLRLEVEWGKAIKPYMVKAILDTERVEAVTITYCETSTGVLNPLKELCRVIRECDPEILILVDAVSAMGGVPIEVEKWGIDVMLFGVQKAFAVPPGLAIGIVSERALEKARSVEGKGYYLNFEVFEKYSKKNNTPTTPAIPQIFALSKQLDRIETEGVAERYNRHSRMQKLIEKWSLEQGFEFFSERKFRSPTISTIEIRKGLKVNDLVNSMKQRGFILSKGYGFLKEKTFRIGHMGEHCEETVENLLKNLVEVINNK